MVWKKESDLSINREKIEKEKIDVSIFKKKTNSKTFKGFLIGKIKQARDSNNFELVYLLSELYKKYMEYQSNSFNPKQWRGKSGVKFIEHPELVISIRFRKSEPKEVRMELLRSDINRLIWAISGLNEGEFIDTSSIAEKYYQKEWKKVFSNRKEHTHLVEMLNYLEFKKKIEYSRSGKVKLLD
jgi:hypothetical protein